MKLPVDHIIRPLLPWRSTEGAITECGYDATQVKAITREEFHARLKEFGQQRTAMLTCMTCLNTAQQWGTWQDDPRTALEREIAWEGNGRWAKKDRGLRLRDELLAIEALIAGHQDEFHASILQIEQRREWLLKKAAHESVKPAKQNMRPL